MNLAANSKAEAGQPIEPRTKAPKVKGVPHGKKAAQGGAGPERLTPAIEIADPGTAYWVGQAILRLRREIAWRRQPAAAGADPAQRGLDLLRHDQARRAYFLVDPACRYLTEHIAAPEPKEAGAFGHLAKAVGLSSAERFVLGLALAAQIDGALAPVLAACQNDAARPYPTLGLAQSLWDEPLAVLAAQETARPLLAFGLLQGPLGPAESLNPAGGLARFLCGAQEPADFGLAPVASAAESDSHLEALAARFSGGARTLETVPLIGPAQGDRLGFLASLRRLGARPCLSAPVASGSALRQALGIAWLSEADLLLDAPLSEREDLAALAPALAEAARLPARLFLHLTSRDLVPALPQGQIGPVIALPATSMARRQALLKAGLAGRARGRAGEIARAARDFRLEPAEIARITAGLKSGAGLIAACRAECSIDFQGLAEALKPRFSLSDIVLPSAIDRQFREAITAIKGTGRVQQDWGGAAKFGEAGIALLFAGVPGTGKTMAAQVLARELDLPLYRVDLSQIVNKYIGETEKNLKRVFDAAEKQRLILFFDEAEALFGKRTEVKDANDRFANVETGYLLQRMESFTGVAVLATNRRKDLDEAFARRLRYVIEFPVPEAAERRRIWAEVFPPGAVLAGLDFDFLAERFQLSGGHIRSIAFNASLQAAARGAEAAIAMRDVLIATKRELDKLDRKSGRETFGPWYGKIEELRP